MTYTECCECDCIEHACYNRYEGMLDAFAYTRTPSPRPCRQPPLHAHPYPQHILFEKIDRRCHVELADITCDIHHTFTVGKVRWVPANVHVLPRHVRQVPGVLRHPQLLLLRGRSYLHGRRLEAHPVPAGSPWVRRWLITQQPSQISTTDVTSLVRVMWHRLSLCGSASTQAFECCTNQTTCVAPSLVEFRLLLNFVVVFFLHTWS